MKPNSSQVPHSQLKRRDFLKLTGSLAAGLPAAALLSQLDINQIDYAQLSGDPLKTPERPNIIVLIYDAFSALHLSFDGYPRRTTPNIDRFAQQATVYHNHHSAGNFTTPSTASFFSGVYPWTHRAFSLGGLVRPASQPNNLFKELQGLYHRLAFTQNIYADQLLYQFEEHLDSHPKLDSFSAVRVYLLQQTLSKRCHPGFEELRRISVHPRTSARLALHGLAQRPGQPAGSRVRPPAPERPAPGGTACAWPTRTCITWSTRSLRGCARCCTKHRSLSAPICT